MVDALHRADASASDLDILDLGPIPQETGPPPVRLGYTGILDRENAGGFLTTSTLKRQGDLGLPRPGRHLSTPPVSLHRHHSTPACSAPPRLRELLARWNRREQTLIDKNPDRVPPLALPPLEDGALLGTLSGPQLIRVAGEAARTVPARENGGNHDIKNFTRGSRIYFPVHVPGANFSGGDLHFCQGTARSRSAGRSRWAGSSTSTSTSSRAGWRPMASRPTP